MKLRKKVRIYSFYENDKSVASVPEERKVFMLNNLSTKLCFLFSENNLSRQEVIYAFRENHRSLIDKEISYLIDICILEE